MHHKIKKIIGIIVLSIAVVFSINILAKSKQAEQPNVPRLTKLFSHKKNLRLLFIQQAKRAAILPTSNKPGCYTLKLTELKRSVLFFSDQPRKLAGHLSTASFMYLLRNNASHFNIKPNVAIEAYQSNGFKKEINFVANLANPVYTGRGRHQVVTYTACPLKKNGFQPIKKIKHINLFFDHLRGFPP